MPDLPERERRMADYPHFPDYLAALKRHSAHPVLVETTVGEVLILTSTLQLALRHPGFPAALRANLAAFLDGVCGALDTIAPVLGMVARLGNDPAHDVPAAEEHTDA